MYKLWLCMSKHSLTSIMKCPCYLNIFCWDQIHRLWLLIPSYNMASNFFHLFSPIGVFISNNMYVVYTLKLMGWFGWKLWVYTFITSYTHIINILTSLCSVYISTSNKDLICHESRNLIGVNIELNVLLTCLNRARSLFC